MIQQSFLYRVFVVCILVMLLTRCNPFESTPPPTITLPAVATLQETPTVQPIEQASPSPLPTQAPLQELTPTIGQADSSSQAGYYYYAEGQRIDLKPSPNEIAVRFLVAASEAQNVIQTTSAASTFTEQTNISNPPLTLLRTTDNNANAIAAAQALNQNPAVAFANPIFTFQDGTRFALSDEFTVKFNENITQSQIDNLNSTYNVEIVAEITWLPGGYIMRITTATEESTLDIANLYYESELTEWAEPNFVRILENRSARKTINNFSPPNDTLFPTQWAHNNTGQNGWTVDADIDTVEAWDINTGNNTITIAIIDDGVDTTHEDLNTVAGFDFANNDNDPNPDAADGHGTACAGIAGAIGNNGLGVAGVCQNCRIMPIKIFNGDSTTNTAAAGAINYAWQQGADILSNSWGGGSASDLINAAIRDAKNNGRSGKGAVIVFASGNHNANTVEYPARLSEVIAVGASSPCDERKSPTSCDGETFWGSNYGPELDVVAPGVIIQTTDIMGSGGYNSDNYFDRFNGTSAATPHVAGLAGLLLSIDPNLTSDQIQNLIETTADDVNNNGRDDEFGHGRINARTALAALTAFNLTVNVVGNGIVNKDPDQANYTIDTNVALTPIPDPGWVFAGWSGDLSGNTNPATITMDSDKTVTATFTSENAPEYTLTINIVGNGTVTKSPDQASYPVGTSVTLTATPAPGWNFVNWSGDLSETITPVTITMDSDKIITANFGFGTK